MTIIKSNDPVCDYSIFWRGCSEHKIPKDSTKPETPVRIFAMMMDMKLMKVGKNFFWPRLVEDPVTKEGIAKGNGKPGKDCKIAVPQNCDYKQQHTHGEQSHPLTRSDLYFCRMLVMVFVSLKSNLAWITPFAVGPEPVNMIFQVCPGKDANQKIYREESSVALAKNEPAHGKRQYDHHKYKKALYLGSLRIILLHTNIF